MTLRAASVVELSDAEPGVDFLGLHFEASDLAHTIAAITARSPAARFAYVVTPNVDHLVRLHCTRSDLWPAYRRAWLTMCDSRIVARLGKFVGLHVTVVTGSDLTAALFARSIGPHDRTAIIGGSSAAIDALRSLFGLENVVHYDPPMGFIDDPAAVARTIRFLIAAKARYVVLAVGSPQQERLAYLTARSGQASGIGLCVGASLDFLTGRQSRAPRLWQWLALEWLYRLGSDPGRLWRRYLVDGPRIFAIVRQWHLHARLPRA